ncbi:GLPGLI family protein [Winogradskyella sp. UBA3174]|uniref:GLPGLI family protein n=1 Tax=Winogradskyella sp. UBA3174 TaxID=1947785 RepID=UPI0025EF6BE1|nr:GLPGLI family protein [Winogradskyella sp. UBA3174]|tara:strand:- start:1258 stop:1995 length:738 start_codon:yes stop_codon:yes gene_type:complete
MQKYILLITLLLSISFCFCQAKGKAYYAKKINAEFEKRLDSLSNEPGNPLKSLDKSTQDLEFILTFNQEIAIYKETEKMTSDNSKTSNKLAKILSGYSGPSYFDFKNKKIIFTKDVFNELYLVNKEISSLEWVLTKEKLVINNLNCYKAMTSVITEGSSGIKEVPIIAWYTTDVNVSAGPDGFGGLPGLIIQLEKGNFITVLTKIEISDKNNKLELPKEGKNISEDDFNELVKEMVVNRRKYNKG